MIRNHLSAFPVQVPETTFVNACVWMSDLAPLVMRYLSYNECEKLAITCKTFQHLTGYRDFYRVLFEKAGILKTDALSYKEALLKGEADRDVNCLSVLCLHYCAHKANKRAVEIIRVLEGITLSNEQQLDLILRKGDLSVREKFVVQAQATGHINFKTYFNYKKDVTDFVYSIMTCTGHAVNYRTDQDWQSSQYAKLIGISEESRKRALVAAHYFHLELKEKSLNTAFFEGAYNDKAFEKHHKSRIVEILIDRFATLKDTLSEKRFQRIFQIFLEALDDPVIAPERLAKAIVFIGYCRAFRLTDAISDDLAIALLEKVRLDARYQQEQIEATFYQIMLYLKSGFEKIDAQTLSERLNFPQCSTPLPAHIFAPLFQTLVAYHNQGDPYQIHLQLMNFSFNGRPSVLKHIARLYLAIISYHHQFLGEETILLHLWDVIDLEEDQTLDSHPSCRIFPKDLIIKAKLYRALVLYKKLYNRLNSAAEIVGMLQAVRSSPIADPEDQFQATLYLAKMVHEGFADHLSTEALENLNALCINPKVPAPLLQEALSLLEQWPQVEPLTY